MKVFVDTDVCIDLLFGRQPFNKTAEVLFSLADKGKIKIFVPLSFKMNIFIKRGRRLQADYLCRARKMENEIQPYGTKRLRSRRGRCG